MRCRIQILSLANDKDEEEKEEEEAIICQVLIEKRGEGQHNCEGQLHQCLSEYPSMSLPGYLMMPAIMYTDMRLDDRTPNQESCIFSVPWDNM